MQRAYQILNNTFGYKDFRHHQADIIETVLNDNDALVLMPTGGGKSLCFQIPAMIRPGTGIIISPLIALMHDQVSALLESGINAAFLNSSQDKYEQQQIEHDLRNNRIDLLYVAPERLLTERTLNMLAEIEISLFAIDEAHCVSQWGHDFRKEYQQLYILHERFPGVPRIALTATADLRTREEIIQQLRLGDAKQYINSFDRPNIRYMINEGQNAREQLWRFISNEHAQDTGIVYCLSRKKVEATAEWLNNKGRTALPYHAGLPSDMRDLHQQRFLREDGIIIVATIAFGMGIDKPDVRFVAHLSLPKSIESYYQETGRAGRDGAPANAWMSYGLQDVISLRQMMQDSDANEQYKRISQQKLESMLGFCEISSCRRQNLLSYFNETMDQPCGNCDNCLNPPETWDGTEAAQKALSCVYRTGQRFGVNYIIDVLTGKEDDRIKQNQHDKLTTFGIGTELNAIEWRSLFRQLIARGYIYSDIESYGSIKLTELARPLLRGETPIELRKQIKLESKKKKKESKSRSALRSVDIALFDQLRDHRMKLAQEHGVPPYIIFHDSTLEQMASTRPASLDEMRYISGVGEQKLKKYGKEFLDIISDNPLPDFFSNQLSDTINETLMHFTQGDSIEVIATKRELNTSTIYTHLAEVIACGLIDMRKVINIDEQQIDEITNTIEMMIADQQTGLKPVFEALDQQYEYGILKCVQASLGESA